MVEVQNFNVDLADSGEMLPVVRDLSFRIPSGHLLDWRKRQRKVCYRTLHCRRPSSS